MHVPILFGFAQKPTSVAAARAVAKDILDTIDPEDVSPYADYVQSFADASWDFTPEELMHNFGGELDGEWVVVRPDDAKKRRVERVRLELEQEFMRYAKEHGTTDCWELTKAYPYDGNPESERARGVILQHAELTGQLSDERLILVDHDRLALVIRSDEVELRRLLREPVWLSHEVYGDYHC